MKITKGLRKLKRPRYTDIFIDNNKNKVYMNVEYHDGTVALIPVSKRAAEVLIARGMNYQG